MAEPVLWKKITLKVVLDIISCVLAFLPWIVLQAINKPFRRGFFCNDESLKHPYKTNTIDANILTVLCIIMGFVLILACELVTYYTEKEDREAHFQLTSGRSLPFYLVRVYQYFGIFVFGIIVQQTIVNIGKYSIGRLRPHFLSLCNPDYSQLNCTVPGLISDIYVYVESYTCVDEKSRNAVDSRLSFPSGHSSFSAFIAVYLCIYLQARFTWRGAALLKHLCQAALIYGAYYVCLSRVSDNKHHPTDVLAGAFIGCFIAALVGIHTTKLFSLKSALKKLGYYPPTLLKYAPNPAVAFNNVESNENYGVSEM
ncbi:hypothetical protein HELRODRAFT_186273 [Helobdella robusta]|uniref:Phosphatidic acid phosphatase type 2/haloperoxidase domain-containing protein n=1 Tax=Helobdella robusta TaxID=6412 RepID=T1FNW3_HELRO|nr:hypothetical protein HELRODRAFT_186273 [Helobdella robusta]ESO10396.1 hypothetical protein HELRODRAFT_186273 [Helobdella robusta]